MDLFGFDPTQNILPKDGLVNYLGPVLSPADSQHFFDSLLHNIPWKNDEGFLFGNHYVTARKVAWFGDSYYAYTYSGKTRTCLPWTPDLLSLKHLIETFSKSRFNSCLLNLYEDGNQGMSWHSDDERELGPNPVIASLSLGAERNFSFKHKQSGQTLSLPLPSGALLIMRGNTQSHWLHSLPKSKRIFSPRINLTFRTIFPD